ncbi:sporulation and cell division protein SsgA [Prauserella shujinwangii]|uniref:Sporulation and cell division protein SsgA n=1 Tax=Prauserella shujinwangii TaxID=1453103 RepID=A0A2T0LQ27_9PSEU|nr:SsgA family sporulation/cell division regulator [Prauserella shujinwangii]PRX45362.1 sporulation and cell division protein SsgA [Prauserella shujinwangii]
MNNDAVHQTQFVSLNGDGTRVLSRLSYVTCEPYTVGLSFRVEPGEWVEWEFARDLLVVGLEQPTGIGDVRVRPDLSLDDDTLLLELESPDGYAVVELRHSDVLRFVGATLELVPPGTEGRHLDLDTLIADLTTARP